MNQLEVGLFTKLTGAGGLTALLAGTASVYGYLAPLNENGPYVVFNKQAGVPEYTFGGTAVENLVYQVRGVTAGPNMGAAGSIAKQIDVALNDQALTVSGYTHLYCRREGDIAYVETDPGGQRWNHSGALYRIVLDPT